MFVPRTSKSTCSRIRLTVLSNFSISFVYIRLCHLVYERSRHCGSLLSRSATVIVLHPPFALSLRRTSRLRRHRRPLRSPTRVVPLDGEEMGKGVVRCLITNSMRLLMNHNSTVCMCRVTREIGKVLKLRILEITWALVCLPSYASLYVNWNPSLTAPAHPRGTPLTYGTD